MSGRGGCNGQGLLGSLCPFACIGPIPVRTGPTHPASRVPRSVPRRFPRVRAGHLVLPQIPLIRPSIPAHTGQTWPWPPGGGSRPVDSRAYGPDRSLAHLRDGTEVRLTICARHRSRQFPRVRAGLLIVDTSGLSGPSIPAPTGVDRYVQLGPPSIPTRTGTGRTAPCTPSLCSPAVDSPARTGRTSRGCRRRSRSTADSRAYGPGANLVISYAVYFRRFPRRPAYGPDTRS